jgi:hypothetical protein
LRIFLAQGWESPSLRAAASGVESFCHAQRPCSLQKSGDFHFVTLSCYRKLPLLGHAQRLWVKRRGVELRPDTIPKPDSLARLVPGARQVTVVDFVAVKHREATRFNKDRQTRVKPFNQKRLIPLNFNWLQQTV